MAVVVVVVVFVVVVLRCLLFTVYPFLVPALPKGAHAGT